MLDAIVIAGSTNTGPLQEVSSEAYEATIKIGPKSMIRYVVDALLASEQIGDVILAGPAELKNLFPEERVKMVPVKGAVIENIVKALEHTNTAKSVLVATCDIPLLTADSVDDFISLCQDRSIDFFYPIVSMEAAGQRFPGIKRTSVRIREGTFTGGNLFIVNPGIIAKCAGKAQEFVNYRKSPFKLSRLLGLKFVAKLLLRRLSIPELEGKVSDIMGIRVKAVVTMFPEIGIDLDKPSDYMVISKYLGG